MRKTKIIIAAALNLVSVSTNIPLRVSAGKPTPIRGFPEFLPPEQEAFDTLKSIVKREYDSFCYQTIETPVVEQISTLEAKGIDGKEVYGLRRLNVGDEEDGSKDLALRFDHTVPLARYVAQHEHDLAFPFKRQAIGPVWRGEKASNGRYRQFYQCDVDIIGRRELPILYDAEPPVIINAIFDKMGIGEFVIRLSNRKILQGIFENFGLREKDKIKAAIKVIDDIEKVEAAETQLRLEAIGVKTEELPILMSLFSDPKMGNEDVLGTLRHLRYEGQFAAGVEELQTVYEAVLMQGVPKSRLKIDIKIARGLDYYTGTVYETNLIAYPGLGSICSGGRYDNLAECYGDQPFPGVGISIGLTRLFSNLLERNLIKLGPQQPTVLVTVQDPAELLSYQSLANHLREKGIATEVIYQMGKLSKQLKYADKKGHVFAVIANKEELEGGHVQVRNLASGEQVKMEMSAVATYIQSQ